MSEHPAPLVSVVIPTYNHARYLGRALQSVLEQSFANWEVIVIDNYSTDNTDDVIANYTDPRVTYLKIHNNGVIAVSRNAGILAARGEWVAFLDSDDWWTADKLHVCLECLDENVDLVYHDLEIVTNQSQLGKRKKISSWQVRPPVLEDLLSRGNAIATSSVIIRKQLLRRLNGMNERPDMVGAEDYNTWLRVAQLTKGFRYVARHLGFYQVHDHGISQQDMSVPMRRAADEFINFLSTQDKNRFNANWKYTKGRFEYLAGNTLIARRNLLSSLRYGRLLIKIKSAIMLIGTCKIRWTK